jgi:hypothetical protein
VRASPALHRPPPLRSSEESSDSISPFKWRCCACLAPRCTGRASPLILSPMDGYTQGSGKAVIRQFPGKLKDSAPVLPSLSSVRYDHRGSLSRQERALRHGDACAHGLTAAHFNQSCQLRSTFKGLLSMETAATRPAKSRRALAVSTGSAFFVLMRWAPLQHTGARRACALIRTGVWRGLGG